MRNKQEQTPHSIEAVYLRPHLDNPRALRRGLEGAAAVFGLGAEKAREALSELSDEEIRKHVDQHTTPPKKSQT
jgi:hypothetical protein